MEETIKVQKGSTFAGATASLVNTVIGSGIICLPYAFGQSGLIMGMALMALSAALSAFCGHLLIILSDDVGGRDVSFFASASRIAPGIKVLIDLANFLQTLGNTSSYLVLIANSVPGIIIWLGGLDVEVGEVWYTHRALCLFMVMALVAGPLASLKSLHALQKMSMMAMGCIAYLVTSVVVFFVMYMAYPNEHNLHPAPVLDLLPPLNVHGLTGLLNSLCVFVFAFTCHQNIFKVYNEMRDPRTVASVSRVIYAVMSTALVAYLILGLFGYVAMGRWVEADLFEYLDRNVLFRDIFNHFDPNRIVLNLGRIALTLLVTTCYPMNIQPCRDAFMSLCVGVKELMEERRQRRIASYGIIEMEKRPTSHENTTLDHAEGAEKQAPGSDEKTMNTSASPAKHHSTFFARVWHGTLYPSERANLYHYSLTLALCSITYTIAALCDDISIVLVFVGATGCNSIVVLFPTYLYMRLSASSGWRDRRRVFAMMAHLFGWFIMLVVPVAKIVEMASPPTDL